MTKFEGAYPKADKDAPAWFKTFLEGYQLVIKFLNQAGKRGLNFADNIVTTTATQRVFHARPTRVTHTLGVAPTSIQLQGGRVESFSIADQTSTTFTLTVRLLSTPCTYTVNYTAMGSVEVLDPTLFNVGDEILINGQSRKVTSIVGSLLGLDMAIMLQLPTVVTLNAESLTLVIF